MMTKRDTTDQVMDQRAYLRDRGRKRGGTGRFDGCARNVGRTGRSRDWRSGASWR